MKAIEIARRLAALEQTEDARRAYSLAIHESGGADPAGELEAAVYILQSGGDYRTSYTCFQSLYNRGHFQEEILPLMEKVFYEPNIRLLKGRYERNCKLLEKYPYLFRRDFLPFEELPIQFFPYDDHNGYVPFYPAQKRFGDFINFKNPVVSRNFFRDLDNPILADDVYSQYELEYLNDNVRKSENIGRENHIYLHYTSWEVFCSYLQCLNMRPLLEDTKLVFLVEDEIGQYPIDFKARFGIDYSQYPVKPLGIREVNRLIWHTQLSSHNGGDFFNEIFNNHPNLLVLPSIMMSNIEMLIDDSRKVMELAENVTQAIDAASPWSNPRVTTELYYMRDRTDKDCLVARYLADEVATYGLDPASRIAPAIFLQPHFPNMVCSLRANTNGQTVVESGNDDILRASPLFRCFKYIKTFTPMRRFTTSHGATVKFMYRMAEEQAERFMKAEERAQAEGGGASPKRGKNGPEAEDEKISVVSDVISERIFNRSFMIDPENRLYKDCVAVRFEDGKLNPKATFTALAAFLDLPYTESMTYCSLAGQRDPESLKGNDRGFDPAAIYRTYDEYINDDERYFIEYFMRDVYAYYGYNFLWYDGKTVTESDVDRLVEGFTTLNSFIYKTWKRVFDKAEATQNGKRVDAALEKQLQKQLLDKRMKEFEENRKRNAKILLEGLRFVNKNGQPLRMMPKLELDPALLEQPLYH